VATLPGAYGKWPAFAAEVLISFILVWVVLAVSNKEKLARFTGLFAGLCVATFITFEAPFSGMSMNPARTFGSAFLPHLWNSLWIYFLAPPIGMLSAASVHLALKQRVACAKLHHQNTQRCIFCEYQAAVENRCKELRPATTHQRMKQLFLLCLVIGLVLPVSAQTKTLLNLDNSGVAIQGHDPVAFFTDGKPVKGKPEFEAKHNGATYRFASKENRDLFTKEPAKYEPQFGGYCAYGVSRNKLAPVDIEAFQIVDGKLLMQYSKGVRDDFNKDTKGNLSKAAANWPGLVDTKGK
jgi:YHS domain-containing protein